MRRRLLFAAVFAAAPFVLALQAQAGDLKSFVRGSWQAIVLAHAGHPFIVHFWGLSCAPCRTEMPAWGKLLAERPDLPLVTINADIIPDAPGEAAAFLAKSGLSNAENWIFDESFVARLRYEIDPEWQGEIPITFLIGRNGAIQKVEGAARMPEVAAWLAEEERPPAPP